MSDHIGLALATLAFVGSHLALSHPLRTRLVRMVGDQIFLALYSVVAAITLVWMVVAYRAIDYSPALWSAPQWAWWVGSGVMLLALMLLIGSFFRNPAFPRPGAKRPAKVREASGVFAVTRHPMNWSFILWAVVHIAVWGSYSNLIVAGGILVLALVGSLGQDHKKLNVIGPPWRDWMARTSFVPFGALLTGRARWRAARPDWRVAAAAAAIWLVVTWFHAPEASPIAALLR